VGGSAPRRRRLDRRRARLPADHLRNARRLASRAGLLQLGRRRRASARSRSNAARGLPTDYAPAHARRNRNYVPKLQAIKNIVAEEFIALNPAYSRPVIPSAANSPLVLPADKVQTFIANLQKHEDQDKPLSAWLTYKLKKGEKLDTVAKRHGMTTARLKQLNGITARTKITPGYALLVPGKDAIGHEALAARLPQTPASPPKAVKPKKGKAGKAKSTATGTRKPAPKPKKR
jgi:membrane-bound lytic murein transglycosylase D